MCLMQIFIILLGPEEQNSIFPEKKVYREANLNLRNPTCKDPFKDIM